MPKDVGHFLGCDTLKRMVCLLLAVLMLTGCTAPTTDTSVTTASTTVVTTAGETTAVTTTQTTVKTLATQSTTATSAKTAREQVVEMLTDSHVADIYADSYSSIFGRLTDNGFLQESLTGMYKGEYVRSIGAFAILADKVGETEKAGKALRFVTDVMKAKNLSYVPFTISADGKTVRTEDELDGRAHFVLGWALYIQKSGDTAYFEDSYALMKREADAFCSDTYFYEEFGLVRNRRFTHTRMRNSEDYHDVFDLLTNSFTVSALEQMVKVANANGKQADAVLWQETLQKIKTGIAENLTREVNGKTVYLEQRYYDNGQGTVELGVSWVCLSPFATDGLGLDSQILQNTAAYVREVLWSKAGKGGYLVVESASDGTVKNWILGKSVGWDIAAAVDANDMSHALKTLQFLNTYHNGTIYMEKMKPTANGWNTIDPGNGEQVIWFLYGIASLREHVGLSVQP